MVGPGQARKGITLQDVGVFLPRIYSTPRGYVMAYRFCPVFELICMLCGLFFIVGRSWTEYMSSWDHRGRAQCPEIEQIWEELKMSVSEFPHHPCKSAAPTSDGHNFPFQTSIRVFLDSTESL